MAYIPLFSESLFEDAATAAEPMYDISFCGTVHSSRVELVAKMIEAPWAKRLRFGLLLYYHSRLLFLAKAIAQPRAFKLFRLIAERPFSKELVARLAQQSRYVLDIPHPGQCGLTARTFEALQAGARLITFNRSASELLPASLADRITAVDSVEDIAGMDFTVPRPAPLSHQDRYYLSLERFVDQLLEQIRLAKAAA